MAQVKGYNLRVTLWFLALQIFVFKVGHWAGNTNAGAHSRAHCFWAAGFLTSGFQKVERGLYYIDSLRRSRAYFRKECICHLDTYNFVIKNNLAFL